MRALVWLIFLGIRVGGFPVRLLLGRVSSIRGRLTLLRPVAQAGLKLLVAARSNRIASIAITLSAINFGLLMGQIWTEDTEQTVTRISQPPPILETNDSDDTSARITQLENQIRDLSREQRFQIDRLRDCINYPSPFGCE